MDVMDLLILLLFALPTPAMSALREFHFVNLPKTWTAAQSYCREKFFDLVTIENAADLDRIREVVENNVEAWIGMYYDVNSWKWSLDDTDLNDRESGDWFDFLASSDDQHCVDVYNKFQLQDQYCNNAERSVCYDESSNSYIEVRESKNWKEAQSFCRQTYTDLASIRNQQEWNKVFGVITTTADRHWIGLSNSWKWSDQSNSSFTQWATYMPNGGNELCGITTVTGLGDAPCGDTHPFICSAAQRKVLKVTLKTDGSVNLNDPMVQEGILKQMEKDLRGQGVHQEFSLRWKKQLHGNVFNKTQL